MNGRITLACLLFMSLGYSGIVGCEDIVVADGTEKYFDREIVNATSPKGNRVLKLVELGDSSYSFTQVLIEF